MQSAVTTVEGAATALLAFLSDPWTLLQLSAIGLAIGAALVLNRWVEPWLEDHVRGVRSRPKLLRLLPIVYRLKPPRRRRAVVNVQGRHFPRPQMERGV